MRRWRRSDLAAFAAINADPEVMEHFPEPLTREQSAELIERIESGFEADGFGLWALEAPGGELVGFTGLIRVPAEMPFAPAVEAGWRLGRRWWGRGLAAEAAGAAIDYGLGAAGLSEVVAYTAVGNERSRRLMERLGMRRDPAEDFLHPALAPADPLAAHVLYRLP
jgi:ribosomal-protein-alanine N-acetyltransferase